MPPTNAEIEEQVLLVLFHARCLVGRGWCRGAFARNLLGFEVSLFSRWATRWCAEGALEAAALTASDLARRRARCRLRAAIGGQSIHIFNGAQKTVEPVLAAFDVAIAESELVAKGKTIVTGDLALFDSAALQGE